MHPFCCLFTMSEQSQALHHIPPLPEATSARYDYSARTGNKQIHGDNNGDCGRILTKPRTTASPATVSHSAREQPVDVKINDIVGNGVSGILYKWVNYGKGWRPRWFVLQDGVLSYYKIHGPDRIVVNRDTEKGSKVIGEESIRRISRYHNGTSHLQQQLPRKPFGEIHLKVSSIRESKSDDKRFSIFTGTKKLHLRAEMREDREAWMEALQAVKDMFPRMSNSELMAPIDNFTMSTEKLRQRLLEEGVGEAAIQDSEQIMRSEFAVLQSQLVLLKQKQCLLIDTLRQLETEKVDLENTVVDESQRQCNDQGASSRLRQDKFNGKMGNSLMRILNVAAFAVSGYSSTEGRICKPFNPLLGETYEADYPDKGLHFFSEKVSHHPVIVACHCEGTGWKFWGDSNLKSKFWGRSIQLDPVGILTLEFDDGEVFQWSKVTTSIYNLILGKLYCDHYGTMRIQGNYDYSCKLKFKEQSIIDRNPHQVHGVVQDRNGKTVATLFGKWDESMYYVIGDSSGKGKGCESLSDARLLWKRSKPPELLTRYNLTRFAITLNELTPGLKEKLPPTDSRLRPDQRYLENGEYEMANAEKLRLEQRQRQARRMQERGWKPRWFVKDKGSDTYRYLGGYWEARERGKWDSCPDIFGHIPSDQQSE
ncbi:hypothetical protein F2P56_035121 [Juglans regia]|uniref:PH domain-containing protein n=1 Tax=Juglans regia TaxID=51240 RepID=A0A833TMI1_JUGRE|nr:hypothetical protein F2P56_035121 [Juglans regia]